MKLTKDKQLSRLIRSAQRHDALSESLRTKLTAREKALKEELAEIRQQLKKPEAMGVTHNDGTIGTDSK